MSYDRLWLSGRASERGIRNPESEVRFLRGTQIFLNNIAEMKKIIKRIFKNLLGILNEDKRTKIIRANCHIEANKSRKDLGVKTF